MRCIISGVLVTSSPEKNNSDFYKYSHHGQLKQSDVTKQGVGKRHVQLALVSRCEWAPAHHYIALGLYKHRTSSLKALTTPYLLVYPPPQLGIQ